MIIIAELKKKINLEKVNQKVERKKKVSCKKLSMNGISLPKATQKQNSSMKI